jgi:hypothetical protein
MLDLPQNNKGKGRWEPEVHSLGLCVFPQIIYIML